MSDGGDSLRALGRKTVRTRCRGLRSEIGNLVMIVVGGMRWSGWSGILSIRAHPTSIQVMAVRGGDVMMM